MALKVDIGVYQKRSDFKSLATVLLHLAFVLLPLYWSVTLEPGPFLVIFWLWFGLSMNGLLNLMHECAHYHVFKARWACDLLGRWVLAPLAFADFDGYRSRHWAHHRHLGLEGDTKDAYLISIQRWRLIAFLLSCLGTLEAFRKFRHQTGTAFANGGSWPSRLAWVMRVLIVQSLIVASLFLAAQAGRFSDPEGALMVSIGVYLFVYVYGLMSLTILTATLRAIAEHQIGTDRSSCVGHAALRNFSCNPVTRLLFGAYGFAEHATHHWEPAIPYYYLTELTARVASQDPSMGPSQGYFKTLLMLTKPTKALQQSSQ